MIKIFAVLYMLALCGTALGQQNYHVEFRKAFDKNDAALQAKVLKRWEAGRPDDPELFVSYLNYYVSQSRHLGVSQKPGKGDSLKLTKEDDPKVIGFLGEQYDVTLVNKGIDYIDRGIAKYPDRLDMRFGKVFVLGLVGDFVRFKDEIIRAVDHSAANKNGWAWLDGKPLENPRVFMLKSLQGYVVQLFDAGDEEAKLIRPIAEAVLRYYPDHVESLSNLAITYQLEKDFQRALPPLIKAEILAPSDPVIIGNLAWCYYNLRRRSEALSYYEKLKKLGDEEQKELAAEKIADINTWK